MELAIILLIRFINFLIYSIFISVIVSWFYSFGIIYPGKYKIADKIYDILLRITEPIVEPIRNTIPPLFGLDFSPIIAMLGLQGLVIALNKLFFSLLTNF